MFKYKKLSQGQSKLLQIYKDWCENNISHSSAIEKMMHVFDYGTKYCFSYAKRFTESNTKVMLSEGGKRYYHLQFSYLEIQEQWDLERSEVESLECVEVFLYGESITKFCPLMKNNKAKECFDILLTKPLLGVFEFYLKNKEE